MSYNVFIFIFFFFQKRIQGVDYAAVLGDIPSFKETPWGVFISTLVWALGGFDSVGALAGEVKPGFYLKGVLLTIPFSMLTYLGPSLLCMVAVPNFKSPLWSNEWVNSTIAGRELDPGYPAIAASISSWLGILMTTCALLAM